MNRVHRVGQGFIGAVLFASAGLLHAAEPGADEFAWRAPLQAGPGASLLRVEVPAAALLRLQSRDHADLRVFNAAGDAVPFALMAPPAAVPAERVKTASYPALPLFSAAGAPGGKGSTEVRVNDARGQRSVWVRLDGSDAPGQPRLNSVLFATSGETQLLGGVEVQGTIPANAPVHVSLSSSPDLAQWASVPARGRLYRFEGGPSNMTLEFDRPVSFKDRFLRLDWGDQQGVAVTGVVGLVAAPAAAPAQVSAPLPSPQAAGAGAVDIATGFATPLAALQLATDLPNSLWPVRVLARNEPSQPWRQVGQTVVYRLANGGADATNPPLALPGVSARWLRIASANGADLAKAQLRATAQFQPVRLVFVATGRGPFELAAGRAATAPGALPLATIAGTLGTRQVDDLPAAVPGPAVVAPPRGSAWGALWPGSEPPGRVGVLWTVLVAGVLALAAVAWSLLRQLKEPQAPAER